MIKEYYITFELSKMLKEKGFAPQPDSKAGLFTMYDETGSIHWGMYDPNWYWRITHQMTLQWLREEHGLNIEVYVIKNYDKKICEYTYTIMDLNFPGSDDGIDCCNKYQTYEDAVEAAIKYCLENLI